MTGSLYLDVVLSQVTFWSQSCQKEAGLSVSRQSILLCFIVVIAFYGSQIFRLYSNLLKFSFKQSFVLRVRIYTITDGKSM